MRTQLALEARRLIGALGLAMAMLGLAAPVSEAQTRRAVPYWVALKSDEAKLRVGPNQDFPAIWLYRLPGLPLKVLQVDDLYPQWRKVEDPDGVQGWMHVSMLRESPAAIVKGGMAELREGPSAGARLLFRVEPGVVGRVNGCSNGWCAMDIRGQRGFVSSGSLWGAIN